MHEGEPLFTGDTRDEIGLRWGALFAVFAPTLLVGLAIWPLRDALDALVFNATKLLGERAKQKHVWLRHHGLLALLQK